MKKIKLSQPRIAIPTYQCIENYLSACSTKGLADKTLRTYHCHLDVFAKHVDINRDIADISEADINQMITAMRQSDMASNSISSYTRTLRAFFNWCNQNDYTNLKVKEYKPTETIKETYTDAELIKLLKKPDLNKCSFSEYRTWVIINFLMNGGCRAKTIRYIQIQDIDFQDNMILFRHTKTRKVQAIPLCSTMKSILADYLKIRGGKPSDYLFCTETGTQLSEDGLRMSIQRYNNNRGIQKTSIHLFRHTFAKKYLLDCNGNAFTLQKLLGHSTLDTTKKYCNLFNSELAKNYDQFAPLSQFKNGKKIKVK